MRSVTYRRWDVVAVSYPFIEGDEAKRRPAVIVSGDDLNASHGVYWVAMITSAKSGQRPEDIAVTDRRKAGLPESCVIRASRLTTLSDLQVSYRLGSIAAKDRRAVTGLLKKYLP